MHLSSGRCRPAVRWLFVPVLLVGLAVAAVADACDPPRIGVVVHGPEDDAFWRLVVRGLKDAAQASGIVLELEHAPGGNEAFQAILNRVLAPTNEKGIDALILSVPSVPAVKEGLDKARAKNIPFITINSGARESQELGALRHVGQDEIEVGFLVGQRLAALGARSALCLIHEPHNDALVQRCRGLAEGLIGTVRTLEMGLKGSDPEAVKKALKDAVDAAPPEAIVSLGPATTSAALAMRGDAHLVVFDLQSAVLDAIERGEVAFAVDQQPYLQGYVPVFLLRQYVCTRAMPIDDIRTGPTFIDKRYVEYLRQLVKAGYR